MLESELFILPVAVHYIPLRCNGTDIRMKESSI